MLSDEAGNGIGEDSCFHGGMEVSAETAEALQYTVWFPDQISSARGPRGDAHSYVHPVLLSQHYDFSR